MFPFFRLSAVAVIVVALFAAPAPAQPVTPELVRAVKAKADSSKTRLKKHMGIGRDVSPVVTMMQQVKTLGEQGRLAEADALLDEVHAVFDAWDAAGGATVPAAGGYGAPVEIVIEGYDGDAMEPFISRDGRYLFFNSDHSVGQKDMYYARRVDGNRFEFVRALDEINTEAVDGVPTMDAANRFYFVSTKNYKPPHMASAYSAAFYDGRVTGVAPMTGISLRKPGWVNMDVEISADGQTLYFSNAWFGDGAPPTRSFLAYARKKDGRFVKVPGSSGIFKTINADDLVYAPAISPDELSIYYTRAKNFRNPAKASFATLVAKRASKTEPFGEPQVIPTITGFAEAPTISGDGGRIYFHRKDPADGRFKIYATDILK